MRRIAIILVLLVLLLSGLIAWRLGLQSAEARGPAGGSGEIEGTEVSLASRVGARILEQRVRKGERVQRGDLLTQLLKSANEHPCVRKSKFSNDFRQKSGLFEVRFH